jgi:type II secretory pathway pseudopilin PulG
MRFNKGLAPLFSTNKVVGFTLIEVLIAAVILFSALAITAELYSASNLSAEKASEKAHFFQISPIAITAIKTEIRQITENKSLSEFSNQLTISGVYFQWQARRIAFKARAPQFDDIYPPSPRFGVFLVEVVAEDKNAKKIGEFQFKVATW